MIPPNTLNRDPQQPQIQQIAHGAHTSLNVVSLVLTSILAAYSTIVVADNCTDGLVEVRMECEPKINNSGACWFQYSQGGHVKTATIKPGKNESHCTDLSSETTIPYIAWCDKKTGPTACPAVTDDNKKWLYQQDTDGNMACTDGT